MSIYPDYENIPEKYKKYLNNNGNKSFIDSLALKIRITDVFLSVLMLSLGFVIAQYLLIKYSMNVWDMFYAGLMFQFFMNAIRIFIKSLFHNYKEEVKLIKGREKR